MKILLVEDDPALIEIMYCLLRKQYVVDKALTAEEAEFHVSTNEYDAIVLDCNLPDKDGIQFCRELRKNQTFTPILMVTGRTAVQDTVMALDAGADDFVTKPFQTIELQARLRALLRRPPHTPQARILHTADLQLNLYTHTVYRGDKHLSLRKKEYQILEYLLRHKGRPISRDKLLEYAWENAYDQTTNTVDVHIKHLRDQVDRNFSKKLIKTVHGFGYKIEE